MDSDDRIVLTGEDTVPAGHLCDRSLPCFDYGDAVRMCWTDSHGRMFISNGEYGNQVNFCPYCGKKADKLV